MKKKKKNIKSRAAVLLGKKSWEKRKSTQGSEYFKKMVNKRWENHRKLSTEK